MNLHNIKGNCYYTDFNKESDRPTLGYINSDKFSLMIDVGALQFHVEDYNQLINKEGLKKPSLAIITHWHWNHTFEIHSLKISALVYSKTQEMLKMMSEWEWTSGAMKKRLEDKIDIDFADEHIRIECKNLNEIKVVSGDIVFSEALKIDLGHQIIDVMHTES